MCSWCGDIGTRIEARRGAASGAEALVRAGAHRLRQTALEEIVDLTHFLASRGFAVLSAQGQQQILAKVPKRFDVVGKPDTLREAGDGVVTVFLQGRQHGVAHAAQMAIRRMAKANAGERDAPKEGADHDRLM